MPIENVFEITGFIESAGNWISHAVQQSCWERPTVETKYAKKKQEKYNYDIYIEILAWYRKWENLNKSTTIHTTLKT